MTSMPQRSHDGQPAGAAHPPCLHEDAADRMRASVDAIYRPMTRKGTVEIRPVIEIPGLPTDERAGGHGATRKIVPAVDCTDARATDK